jgi:hypothetical protein
MTSAICAVPNCRRIVSPKHLTCLLHWEQVPQPLRDALDATYHRYTKATEQGMRAPGRLTTTVQVQALTHARQSYLAARAAAIQSVLDQTAPAAELKTRDGS